LPAQPHAYIAKRLPTTPASEDAPPANIRFGPLTRQHLAQYDEWIKAPRNHYFIQLLAADATEYRPGRGLPCPRHRGSRTRYNCVYRSSLSGRDRTGVIYGDFETREEAIAAMQALPETIKAIQPFPRQVSKLHC
jgi:MSHA biogenesis protein MshM